MAETFLQLSKEDRANALGVAAERSGRPTHLLEKDIWVVWALRAMFESPFGERLVFKGGTSLSKAYGAIKRFSEDVDLTYDIRALVPHLMREGDDEALPSSKSEQKKWRKEIEERLSKWIVDDILSLIRRALDQEKLVAQVSVHPDDRYAVQIEYEAATSGTGYVRPVVILEFGAKSTGEPCEPIAVRCDAAEHLPSLSFPQCTPRVMKIERTFWEKATAVHVVCMGGKLRGAGRFSRHLYDLVQLDAAGRAASALAMKDIAGPRLP